MWRGERTRGFYWMAGVRNASRARLGPIPRVAMGYSTSLEFSTLVLIVAIVAAPMLLCVLGALATDIWNRLAIHDLSVRVAVLRIGMLRRAAAFGQLDEDDEAELGEVDIIENAPQPAPAKAA